MNWLFTRATPFAAAALLLASSGSAVADERPADVSAGNLLVVLRESTGQNKLDESLVPYGWITARMPDGKRVDLAPSWYKYLGDMHIRIVFDAGQQLQSASPGDLERLRLTPEEALDTAMRNMRRRYGSPVVSEWSGGLMQVQGESPDLSSSYFLDRDLWTRLEREHPEGLVAAVPRRGGLVFASAADQDALATLRFSASALYSGNSSARVSSALYLFKGGHWSVYEPPRAVDGQ